ncbi:MAG: TetR/AcrR family transcriptional regulator [Chloroflexi bacterium]|nr:TetR/AcrR family transcriptional regulator [Chloroflexota bacterium]
MADAARAAFTDARRSQILDAAARCFAQNGFHKTAVHDIAREAGLSPGAVYIYFASKDQVIESMLEQVRQGYQEVLDAARRQQGPVLDALLGLAEALFAPLSDEGFQCQTNLRVQLWAEALRNQGLRQAYVALMDSARSPVSELVRRGQQRGELDPGIDADAIAMTFIALFQGSVLHRALYDEIDVPSYLQTVKALVTRLAVPPVQAAPTGH